MKSNKSCVLTINGGSSGIKFSLYQIGGSLMRLFYGEIESIGTKNTKLRFAITISRKQNSISIKGDDHDDAATFLLNWL